MIKRERKVINFKPILVIFCILALGFFIWRFLIYSEKCESWNCFNNNLESCKRTTFVGGSEMIFRYEILGKTGDRCEVNITLLQGEVGNQDSKKIEGKSMTCSLPLGVVMIPESNLIYCSGVLKESFQELFINKLYTYIVQNLGRINLEILDPRKIINQSL
ncbi:MAG: hypothetical protein WC494_03425 [Candidatus Pacearchaeota archaeon]